MERLVQELGELRQTAAQYKTKLVENMSLLNLTVAALTKLQELPAHLLKIQQQIDISVENKNYDFDEKIKLWNQTQKLQNNVILSDFGDRLGIPLGCLGKQFLPSTPPSGKQDTEKTLALRQ